MAQIDISVNGRDTCENINVRQLPSNIKNIEIGGAPSKTYYVAGDTLNLTDLWVQLTYKDGTTTGIGQENFTDYGITVTAP